MTNNLSFDESKMFDDLTYFFFKLDIQNIYIFLQAEKQTDRFLLIYSFPRLDYKDKPLNLKDIQAIKFQNSLNLETITVLDSKINLTFLFPPDSSKGEKCVEAIIPLIKSYITMILTNFQSLSDQILSYIYRFTLLSMINENLSINRSEKYFNDLINIVVEKLNASYGLLNLHFMVNNQDIENSYLSRNYEESNLLSIDIELSFEKQFAGILRLYFNNDKIDSLKYIKKLLIIDKIKENLSFLIFAFFYLNEQKQYIENLEQVLVQSKSEIKQKNHQLLKNLHIISELEQTKNNIFNKIYHQLLTPLNSILGFTMFIDKFQKDNIPIDILGDIENIEENAYFLLYNILDIIDYSRLTEGKIDFIFEPFNFSEIYEVLRRIIDFLQKYFGKKVDFKVSEGDFVFIHDYKHIEQIIFSLLFFLLSNKNISSYQMNISFEKKERDYILVAINTNSPVLSNEYFDKLIYYKENIDLKSIKEFALEDFMAYCTVQLLLKLNDEIDIENLNYSAIINLRLYDKGEKNENV